MRRAGADQRMRRRDAEADRSGVRGASAEAGLCAKSAFADRAEAEQNLGFFSNSPGQIEPYAKP